MKTLTFLKLWFNTIRNSISTLRKQSRLKVTFVFISSLAFLAFEFLVCYRAFSFIRDFPGVGSIVSERLLYLFYFAVFTMLIFSNALVAYTTIYRSGDTELLFAYPLTGSTIFRYKFLESAALSCWAFLVLLIPFMISFGLANSADWRLYLFIALFFIPFLLIAGAIGAFFTVFLVRIMPGKRLRWVIIFTGLAVMGCLYLAVRKIRFEEPSQTIEIFFLNQLLPNIRLSHSPFWPSYWMAEGILKASSGRIKETLFYFLLLLSTALFLMEILMGAASRFYRASWIEIRSRSREKLFITGKGFIERIRPFLDIFGRDICGLVTKDMKLFWRDPGQYMQFLIFFGLLAIYFFNIRNFAYDMLAPFWKNICAFLNLAATLLTLGSLGTRFIFPQISMEGNKFWIIGLAPVGLKKILYQKFWMSVVMTLFVTEGLIIISNRMLGIDGIMMQASLWTVFIMNFALVGLAVGLGAWFPDFKSQNPASIVSGFGGTLTLMLSMTAIFLSALLLVLPFQLFLKGHISTYGDLKKALFFSMILVSFIGLTSCIVPLLGGHRRLQNAEF